jgi:hypothetical protein
MYKAGQTSYNAPGDHDSGYPLSRAPALDDQRAWYLEKNISQIKHADAEAVNPIAETQIGTHAQIGKGDINPVDIVHEIEKEDEREEAVRNSSSRSNANFW